MSPHAPQSLVKERDEMETRPKPSMRRPGERHASPHAPQSLVKERDGDTTETVAEHEKTWRETRVSSRSPEFS